MQILDVFLRDSGILMGTWENMLTLSNIYMQILAFKPDHACRNVSLTAVKLQMFGGQTCHVWYPIKTCFFFTYPRLDENDGIKIPIVHERNGFFVKFDFVTGCPAINITIRMGLQVFKLFFSLKFMSPCFHHFWHFSSFSNVTEQA